MDKREYINGVSLFTLVQKARSAEHLLSVMDECGIDDVLEYIRAERDIWQTLAIMFGATERIR